MFEFLVQAVSGLDLAAESPSPTLLLLSLPGFAKMPTTRVVRIPQSTVLAPSGQERTHSHTHPRSPSDCWANAGQSLSAGSGLGLNIFRRGPTPIQKLSPSSLGSSWWHFLPSSSPPHPGGPDEQFPLSRDPALGYLPSSVHGLSTPTPPHPTRLFSPLTIPPSPSVGGGSAQRRGDSGLFWAFPGMQTSFFSEALFCFHNPPTCRSVGTSEERRGRGSCPPHFLG